MRRAALLLGLSCAPLAPGAAAQTVRLYTLADSVHVGEQFAVAVTVERAAGAQVLFPEPPRGTDRFAHPLAAGDTELLALRRFPPALRGAVRVDSAVYEAVTFTLDRAAIGPLAVGVVVGSDTLRLASPEVTVPVRSALQPGIEDPLGPLPPADFPRPLAPWLIAALVGLAAGLLGFLLWRRRQRRALPDEALPPAEAARRALAALEATTPGPGTDPGPFYDALSDALRRYLARTLGAPAPELTTDELARALDAHPEPIPSEARAAALDALRRADRVKFANHLPPPEAHAQALGLARTAVDALEAERQRAEDERAGEPAR